MRLLITTILSLFLSVSFAVDSGIADITSSQNEKSKEAAERVGGKPVQYPKLTDNSYSVTDDAKVLNKDQTLQLNKDLFNLFQKKKVNLKLVTISDLKSMYAEDLTFDKYAAASYSQWNITAAGSDLRILVSFNKSSNEIFINGPSSWQKDNEANIKALTDEYFMPQIKEGKVGKGLLDGMEASIEFLETGSLPSSLGFYLKLIVFLALVGYGVYFSIQNPDNKWVIKVKELLAQLFSMLKEKIAALRAK